ncbi:hypothetical protein CONCODRAFT_84138 [Conidiobolus coronatus NRRL 28638]|uniref:Histone H1 n=1 Tax=Conidiobolus coronatus (strain ATCC 28846 / CBS 209.66 / NRRL 28638) TaxID=796925 RepID=A0A137PBH5_CONC2|nr:hypothetical protein CONCODRAFT_84138 [Conidiobolus coronatus NRRL 28638]|eukprot:KXN72355.1 hypothetical protein CONCODRAFT_84138 [Conidiobolus coronatus NRRL 28638]
MSKVASRNSEHPTYKDMIATAIKTQQDRKGSSRQAILKYILENYKVKADNAPTQVRLALKRGVDNADFKSESGSRFKLGDAVKKALEKKAAAAKKAAKPAAAKPKAKPAPKAKATPTKATPTKAKTTPAKKPVAKKTKAAAPSAPKKAKAIIKSKKAVATKKKSPAKKATAKPAAKSKKASK